MSTIQTQVNVVHLQSGLGLASGVQRTTEESAFTPIAYTVGTTDEEIVLGGVVAPKQVIIKMISGDGLKIGFDGSDYPLRLMDPEECAVLRLDLESISYERSTITCIGDTLGSLGGTCFLMADLNGPVQPWLNIAVAVAATGSITYGAPVDGDVIYVDGAPLTKVASTPGAGEYTTIVELEALIEALTGLNSTQDGTTIFITAATAGTAGNSITVYTDGSNTGTMTVAEETLTGGVDASTAPTAPTGGRNLAVVIVANDSASSVCTALKNALDADAQFTATNASPPTVIATDVSAEARTAIVDVDTGFTVSRETHLSGTIPTVHLKSLGSSDIAVAVAPL